MGRWRPGESGRPPVEKWPEERIRAFAEGLRAFRVSLNLTARDLEAVLGYDSNGKYVRMLEGEWGWRQPSARFVERLEMYRATDPQPKREWVIEVAALLNEEAVPLGRINAERRQCLECVARVAEGTMEEGEAWFWPGHPQARYCREHRKAGRRRRRWFRRCVELECEGAVEVEEGVWVCRGQRCKRRRRWGVDVGD